MITQRMSKTVLFTAAIGATAVPVALQSADACQPPPPVMFQDHGTEEDPLFFTDSMVAISIDVEPGAVDPQFHVTPLGMPDSPTEGEARIAPPSDTVNGDYLLWTPTEELPDGDYQVGFTSDHGWDNTTIFRHVSTREAPDLQAGDLRLTMHEQASSDQNCCDIAECEAIGYDCTGGSWDDHCRSCWSLRYEYRPRLEVPVQFEPGSYLLNIYRGEEGDDQLIRSRSMSKTFQSVSFTFDEDADGPFCVRLEVERIADGTIISDSGTLCADEEEMEPYEMRKLDNTDAMRACDTLPEDPQDPNWVEFEREYNTNRLPPAGSEDIEDVEPRKRRGPMAACTVTSHGVPAASPLFLLFAALGGLFAVRRRA